MSDTHYSSVITRVGQVFVTSGPEGVTRIFFGERGFRDYLEAVDAAALSEGGVAGDMASEIALYFEGKLSRFETPIDIAGGTLFQQSVWKKLLDVPYGGLTTYRDLAENVGRPAAARAVGNAVGANPIPIVIPCHRVVASNGLGGYSCGLDIKKDLLRIEGALA